MKLGRHANSHESVNKTHWNQRTYKYNNIVLLKALLTINYLSSPTLPTSRHNHLDIRTPNSTDCSLNFTKIRVGSFFGVLLCLDVASYQLITHITPESELVHVGELSGRLGLVCQLLRLSVDLHVFRWEYRLDTTLWDNYLDEHAIVIMGCYIINVWRGMIRQRHAVKSRENFWKKFRGLARILLRTNFSDGRCRTEFAGLEKLLPTQPKVPQLKYPTK